MMGRPYLERSIYKIRIGNCQWGREKASQTEIEIVGPKDRRAASPGIREQNSKRAKTRCLFNTGQ